MGSSSFDASEKQRVWNLISLGDVVKNLGPRPIAYWPENFRSTVDLIKHSHCAPLTLVRAVCPARGRPFWGVLLALVHGVVHLTM